MKVYLLIVGHIIVVESLIGVKSRKLISVFKWDWALSLAQSGILESQLLVVESLEEVCVYDVQR